MAIKLTIEAAAKTQGINSQKELAAFVKERTNVNMRAATISDMYRNNKTAINREHLETIMVALGITDFNKVMTIEDESKKDPAE